MNTIIDTLNWRYAVKEFDPSQIVSQNQLESLIESIRLTPTAFGLQHFKIIILTQSQVSDQIATACFNQKQIKSCSHLILLITNPPFSEETIQKEAHQIAQDKKWDSKQEEGFIQVVNKFIQSKTTEQVHQWQVNQTYLALGQLLLSCAIQKIDSCPMEGFVPSQINTILNIPSKHTTTLLCPIGYRKDQDPLQKVKSRPSLENLQIPFP